MGVGAVSDNLHVITTLNKSTANGLPFRAGCDAEAGDRFASQWPITIARISAKLLPVD